MEAPTHGPDPVDGLRLAMLQQREAKLQARVRFSTFGVMEALLLAMLMIGIVLLANTEGDRTHTHLLVVGWLLIMQAVVLYFSRRYTAAKELQHLKLKISAVVQGQDGEIISRAAIVARSTLLRKPSP